jgi:NAD(P)-dependent dehydrogenase (short-subunit alcohol dehydrogenase family)
VVTGGAGGIGRGLIERLVGHEGAHLIACVDRPESKIKEFVADINKEADREAVIGYAGNASEPDFMWSVFDDFVKRTGGPPEILVNLMGKPLDALMENYKPGSPPRIFAMDKLVENLVVNAAAPAERAWGQQPEGARRRAGICGVAAPRRCHRSACVAAPCICPPGARAKV